MDVSKMVKGQVKALEIAAGMLDEAELRRFVDEILQARRIFVAGCGRSLLSLLGYAMRLMHLGKEVYIVGDVLTPAFRKGDTLFVASASGSRQSLIYIARKAKEYGGRIDLFTSKADSELASYADHILMVPVDGVKETEEYKKNGVDQNGGNIFEELILVLADSLVEYAADTSDVPRSRLMELHANFE